MTLKPNLTQETPDVRGDELFFPIAYLVPRQGDGGPKYGTCSTKVHQELQVPKGCEETPIPTRDPDFFATINVKKELSLK